MKIENGKRLLFIGDSITDAGRWDVEDRFHGLTSFSKRVAEYINNVNGCVSVEVINRGVSGFRSGELLNKFDEFVTDLKPDYVVMMIGINDTWHNFSPDRTKTTMEMYDENVRKIIDGIEKLGAKLIVMEPFLTKNFPYPEEFYKDWMPKAVKLRAICRENDLEYIPLDGLIARYEIEHKGASLSDDGVHPNELGRAFIANEIIKKIEIA